LYVSIFGQVSQFGHASKTGIAGKMQDIESLETGMWEVKPRRVQDGSIIIKKTLRLAESREQDHPGQEYEQNIM
jgi:hypothetical protein